MARKSTLRSLRVVRLDMVNSASVSALDATLILM